MGRDDVKSYIEGMKKEIMDELVSTNIPHSPVPEEAINGAESVRPDVGSEDFKLANLPKTTCSVCHENKVRLRKKTPKKVSRQYYENELGQAWNGRRCADCVQTKAREHMRSKRAAKKEKVE
jgi:hypothetical protein